MRKKNIFVHHQIFVYLFIILKIREAYSSPTSECKISIRSSHGAMTYSIGKSFSTCDESSLRRLPNRTASATCEPRNANPPVNKTKKKAESSTRYYL